MGVLEGVWWVFEGFGGSFRVVFWCFWFFFESFDGFQLILRSG